MKTLTLLIFTAMCTGCSTMQTIAPDHMSFSPSVEAEMMKGCDVKYKPKVAMNFDWEFKMNPSSLEEIYAKAYEGKPEKIKNALNRLNYSYLFDKSTITPERDAFIKSLEEEYGLNQYEDAK